MANNEIIVIKQDGTVNNGQGGGGAGGDASAITYTPALLTSWNSSADPGNVDGGLDQLASRTKTLETASSNPDAANVTYTPAVLTNWNSNADPGDVDNALDQVAARVKTLEATPATDASGITYTPNDLTDWGGIDPGNTDDALDYLAEQFNQIDASEVLYVPSTLSNWNSSVDPGNTDDAIDQLASRTKTLETGGTNSVKVTTNDTTPGFLNGKLVAGTGISLTVLNPSGDEDLQISASVNSADVIYTPAVVTNWNSSADPGDTDNALDQLAARVKTIETSGSSDASGITYTPAVLANWNSSADPGNVDGGLDQLASRTKTIENNGGKVLTNGTDSTYNYLANKLVAGANITLTVNGTSDKTITIESSAGASGVDDIRELVWTSW